MKLRPLSKSVAVSFAIAAPLLLLTGGAPLAKKPGTDVDCTVGTAAYPTIQSAVNTPACKTIGVPAGKFRENVIIGRDLEIRGAGPERTTVDATGKNSPVFAINGPTSRQPCEEPAVAVTLAGMTITGGTGPTAGNNLNGGGIEGTPGVKLTVENCIVTGNSAYMQAGGINVPNGRLTIVDSVISRNTAYANPQPNNTDPNYISGGGGVRVAGCPAVLIVEKSEIKDNVSLRQGGGILVNASPTFSRCVLVPPATTCSPTCSSPCVLVVNPAPAATVVMTDTKIEHNTAADAYGGGGIYYNYADLTVFDSKIEHNYPDDLKPGAIP